MKKQWWTLAFLAIIQGMIFLDNAIVNIALPTLQETFHIDTSALQWVITAYTLCFGGFLLLGGRAADLFGRKRVLLISLLVFLLSSLFIGLAANSTQIIICRGLQGLAAGFMAPSALSLVLITFKGKERARALAVWSAVGSVGAGLGLSLGGIITQHLGWSWIFFLNIPFGFIAFLGIYKYIPSNKSLPLARLDWLGGLLITSSLLLLVFTFAQVAEAGWSHSLLSGGVSALLIGIFIYHESRVKHPLIPLGIFHKQQIAASNIAMMGVSASLYGMLFFASLYVQNILQYPPALCGLCFLLFPVMVATSSTIAPWLLQKVGLKPLLLGGISLICIGTYSMTFITEQGTYFTAIFPGLVAMAAGLGMTYLAINTAATQGVVAELSGLASGLITTSQQIGSAIGLALLTGVAASVSATSLDNGMAANTALTASYKSAFWGVAICAAFAFVASCFMRPRQTSATLAILADENVS